MTNSFRPDIVASLLANGEVQDAVDTGTPVDQTLRVSLKGIEAMHIGWHNGVKIPGRTHAANNIKENELTPESITAFMVGLKSKMATFRLQRQINTYPQEPLTAILPGVTLTQLWQMMSVMENTLRLISTLVLLASLLGLAAMLLASIRERQREIAVMRAIGAPPWFLLALIEMEALLITLAGSVFALVLLNVSTSFAEKALTENFSLFIENNIFTPQILSYLLAVVLGTAVVALIPGISIYKSALHQTLAN